MGREPVWDDGKVMEVHSGDDCTAMQMCLMPPRQILCYVYYIYMMYVCTMRDLGAMFLPEMLLSLHIGGHVNSAHNSVANSFRASSYLSLVSM